MGEDGLIVSKARNLVKVYHIVGAILLVIFLNVAALCMYRKY
jgi:hypothetical protein